MSGEGVGAGQGSAFKPPMDPGRRPDEDSRAKSMKATELGQNETTYFRVLGQ